MTNYSIHYFLFPFQWNYISSKRRYKERTRLEDFDRLFMSCGSKFKKVKFNIGENATKFNEYNYFHSFARNVIYNTEKNNFLEYYELDEPGGEYNIEILTQDGGTETYYLNLDRICLHVYDTGVGVVSFKLSNDKYDKEESILKINEYGRRLYPQFMAEGEPLSAKKEFLPNRIYGQIGDLYFDEDFSAYEEPISIGSTFIPPKHILSVFGYRGEERMGDRMKNFVFNDVCEKNNSIRIKKVTDDRMFFLSWYGNNTVSDHLKTSSLLGMNRNDTDIDSQSQDGSDNFWYAFVLGDRSKESSPIKDKKFKREEIIRASYTRWLEYGTLYGITRDAFVCVSSRNPGGIPIWEHMDTMYYQMAILCLVQRATILRFSLEISLITNHIFSSHKGTQIAITDLYENYLRFINQIHFREVSPQIQGIELYDMFQEAMNLDKEAKDLDDEMQELFDYLSVKEQGKLSKIADLFLPISLLAGVLGINTLDFEYWNQTPLVKLVTGLLILWTIYAILKYLYNKKIK